MGTRQVLVYVLTNALALLHPFMPFITEEIWQSLPHEGDSLMMTSFPKYDEALNFKAEAAEFEMVMAAIRGIRNARANADVPPSRKATVYIKSEHPQVFAQSAAFFERLASASSVIIAEDSFDLEQAVRIVTDNATILLPMDELIDKAKELARLNKELAACEKDLQVVGGKLNNEGFVAKAPPAVIVVEREKFAKATERLGKIKESIAQLKK